MVIWQATRPGEYVRVIDDAALREVLGYSYFLGTSYGLCVLCGFLMFLGGLLAPTWQRTYDVLRHVDPEEEMEVDVAAPAPTAEAGVFHVDV